MEELESYNIQGFIDNNRVKVGKLFCGKPIFSPSVLSLEAKELISILTTLYKEIKQEIENKYLSLDIE